MTTPKRRAATNHRYYIKRKYGLNQQSSPPLKLEDQPKEIRDKILKIKLNQQKMPREFFNPKLKTYCEVCHNNNNLVCHHIKYTPIKETITVCSNCHSLIHGRNLGLRNSQKKPKITINPGLSYIV